MIHYVKGNLLESEAEALVNTVNTVGVMGKGIALQFKEAFPENFRVYKKACQKKEMRIGDMLIVKDSNLTSGPKLIVNPDKDSLEVAFRIFIYKAGTTIASQGN